MMTEKIIKQTNTLKLVLIYPQTMNEDLLSSLMKLRGKILYNDGDRPEFFNGLHTIADDDGLDKTSHHLLMFNLNELVGGVRCTSIDINSPKSVLLDLLGVENYKTLLDVYENQSVTNISSVYHA